MDGWRRMDEMGWDGMEVSGDNSWIILSRRCGIDRAMSDEG